MDALVRGTAPQRCLKVKPQEFVTRSLCREDLGEPSSDLELELQLTSVGNVIGGPHKEGERDT